MEQKKIRRAIYIFVAIFPLLLAGCSSSSSSDASDVSSDLLDYFTESANVSSVKDASLSSCPSATLGQMADAFMTNPSWRDFPSTSGGTVVELTGEISYDGFPSFPHFWHKHRHLLWPVLYGSKGSKPFSRMKFSTTLGSNFFGMYLL